MYITTYFYFDTKKILVILQMQFYFGRNRRAEGLRGGREGGISLIR